MIAPTTEPDLERTLEHPATITTTVRLAEKYGKCCGETAFVLDGLLQSANLTEELRAKFRLLRAQQRHLCGVFAEALTEAAATMREKEQGMLELPLSPSHNRPPATGRFAICEMPTCGNPIATNAQAYGSLKRRGNRLCVECERQLDANGAGTRELPLEGTETSEAPQAFR